MSVADDSDQADDQVEQDLRVVFVCWGNICRSPMAERVARRRADEAGIRGVQFTSAATSTEELGAPIDPRAARTLTAAGYDAAGHRAHQISRDEARTADVLIAMEPVHVERLRRISGQTTNVRLLSDFDPEAEPGSGLPDPWYGDEDGFADTLAAIETSMPGVLEWVRERAADRR